MHEAGDARAAAGHYALALEARPYLTPENAGDLRDRRERAVQVLHKAEAGPPLVVEHLKCGNAGVIDTNLAVANDAISRELKSSDLE